MPEIPHKNDELRVGPRNDARVRSSTGLLLWGASIFAVLVHQLLPLTGHINTQRLTALLTVSSTAAALSIWLRRRRAAKIWEGIVIATGWLLTALLVKWSGGAESVFVALYLFPMVYAAYFLRVRNAIAQIGFGSALAMAPLIYDAPGSAVFHLPSHLSILLATFWGLSFAVGARKRELSRAELAARREALTDPLTGALNLRSFRAEAEIALEKARRSGRPVTISMVDLDGLKTANAQHGHLGGDVLIRAAATVLQSAARSRDSVARVGGDEFAIVLKDHGAENVAGFEHRLEEMIDRINRSGEAGAATLSLSVGSAVFPDDGSDLRELMAAADLRMYTVKRASAERSEQMVTITEPIARRVPPDEIETVGRDTSTTNRRVAMVAAMNWPIVAVVLMISLLVPNADRDSAVALIALGAFALFTAGVTYAIAARRPVGARIFSDMMSYIVIFPAMALTGPDTTLLPLTLVPIAHAAYFLSRKDAVVRFIATITLTGAPLLTFDSGHETYATKFVALAFSSAVIAYVLQLNRSAIQRAETRARDLSRIDPLTGVPNRRSFEEKLRTIVNYASIADHAHTPTQTPALVFIDLDNFKQINTALGHLGGDVAIKSAADALARAAGEDNFLFRVGGDEFAVLVTDVAQYPVAGIAEQCRLALRAIDMSAISSAVPALSGSVGFAIWTPESRRASDLMEQADIALGDAKRAGKDSVVGASSKAGAVQRRPAEHL